MTACGLGLAMGLGLLAATEFLGEETLHDMLTFNPGNFFTYASLLQTDIHCLPISSVHPALCPAPDFTVWQQQQTGVTCVSCCRFFLPPIIFSAGLSVRKKSFFRNFVSIASLGILGTYVALTFIVLTLLLYRKCFGFLNMQVNTAPCLHCNKAGQVAASNAKVLVQ